jgi:hypothetical protein
LRSAGGCDAVVVRGSNQEARVDKGTVRWLMAGGLVLVGACVLQTETVSGPKGDPGDPGSPGATNVLVDGGVVSIQALADLVAAQQQTIAAQQEALAGLKAQVDALADPDCPAGYTLDALETKYKVCKKGADQVVKVGGSSSAFWIDRYEATLWDAPDGAGAQWFGGGADDSSKGFPKNGQATQPLYAASVAGVAPAGSLTWFQASIACAASGKHLPTGAEWLRAAQLTADSGAVDGNLNGEKRCNTLSTTWRLTANAIGPSTDTSCVSMWGAEDMIGNVREWIDQWYALVAGPSTTGSWPAGYAGDVTVGVGAAACFNGTNSGCATQLPVPIPAYVGGDWGAGDGAGIFNTYVDSSPASWHQSVGFRCLVPR